MCGGCKSLKTGALIAAACEAGAVLARAPDEQRAALKRYGENLGLAFQIADDLLDAEGDAQAMGKATGKDSAAGKATLVGLIGIEEARAQLAAAVANAERELQQFGDKAGDADRGRAFRRQPRALSDKTEGAARLQKTPSMPVEWSRLEAVVEADARGVEIGLGRIGADRAC